MATSDWLPVVTTALGGLLAAGGGALVQWTSNRGADERAREDLRRTAYVGLLTATDALLPEIRRWPAERNSERLMTAASDVLRACAAVRLAGPKPVIEKTKEIHRLTQALVQSHQDTELERAVTQADRFLEKAHDAFLEQAELIIGTNRQP
jgi:hypothetical protein